jgi:TRAP-type C4-dicarboxylate transport system substrate-binding protein
MAALLLPACSPAGAGAGEPVPWRFAIEETRGSVQDAYAMEFKRRIEAKSEGAIAVSVYPYGTLGTSDHVTELLAMGTVQFAMASPGHLGTLIPEVQAFLLHFLLTGDEATNNRALGDPALKAAFDDLYEEKGLALLSILSEGWMVWTTQKPVRRPADFAGVKIRTMTSPLLLAAYRAYGARPTPLPYGEVYSALQLNMIDAQVNPVFAIQEMSFYEVVDYLVFPRHAPFITTVASNSDFLAELSEGDRAMVLETIRELQPFNLAVQQRFNAERLALIRERKPSINIIDDLTEAERAAFREASRPVYEQYLAMAGRRGEQVLAAIHAAVERARTGGV